MALYGAETWTLREADQKNLEIFKCGAEILSAIITVLEGPTVSCSGRASERRVSSTDMVVSLRVLVCESV